MTRRKREIVGLTNEQDLPHLVELATYSRDTLIARRHAATSPEKN